MDGPMEFFTATCLYWQYLLAKDEHKAIITNSLKFLVENTRVWVYGFVVMPNHIHLLWRKRKEFKDQNVQQVFLKYTAQQIRFRLMDANDPHLELYRSTQGDRKYQFWERRPYKVSLSDGEVARQKLGYIHYNPVKAGICQKPEEYYFSSSRFYRQGVDDWGFLTHYKNHL